MKKIYSSIFVLIGFGMLTLTGYSQAAGNHHLTMSLQNCSQLNDKTIQFDLYVTNDGSSDLRANSFQCGLNFNKEILKAGSTVSVSMVKGSADFTELNDFNFPSSATPGHLRIVQSAYTKANTGKSMVAGHPYKIGTFQLNSSNGLMADHTPDFSFQTSSEPGKTVCAAVVWVGTSSNVTSVTIPAGNDGARKVSTAPNSNNVAALSAKIECRMGKNPTGIEQAMSVYPNPASGKTTVTFNSGTSADYHLTILDMSSREVMNKDGKFVAGSNTIELDLSHLAKGAYLINLKSGDSKNSERIVVQ